MGDQMKKIGMKIHVTGDFALFTKPSNKAERASFSFITPSAARGVIESCFWKPEIRYRVSRIHVLNPIKFINMRRNEVGAKIPSGTATSVMKSGGRLGMIVEKERQQRGAMMLRDVSYVIEATFDVIGGTDPPGKYLAMFERRVKKGQHYTMPTLGTRECTANVRWCEEIPKGAYSEVPEHDFGMVLHDIDYENDRQPRFFHAIMRHGVIDVPPWQFSPEVKQ